MQDDKAESRSLERRPVKIGLSQLRYLVWNRLVVGMNRIPLQRNSLRLDPFTRPNMLGDVPIFRANPQVILQDTGKAFGWRAHTGVSDVRASLLRFADRFVGDF